MQCKLCGNTTNNTPYPVKEMSTGTREIFDYFQCDLCQCLQIAKIPNDIRGYYENNYYSFTQLESDLPRNPLKKIRDQLVRLRDIYAITNKGIVGRIFYALRPSTELRALALYKVNKNTSILDVGCGSGHYLYKLKSCGFKNLLGVDPYLEKTITYKNGLTIEKGELTTIQGSWDVIMLHHSLEHMKNQVEVLTHVSSLLKKDGICLIRIPTVSSIPWEEYREDWVCIEAPKHFFLHSHKSLTKVANDAGLQVISITSDSNPYSFYGSEYYRRDIPATEWKEEEFSKEERKFFAKRAKEINVLGQADMIAVILKTKENANA
jgi:2-polyprenyl-3-methyl-5-hydroxy-6-metoxy-1,4-benzoquinol methylase